MQFFKSQKNNAIGKEVEKDGHKIYALNDVKQYIAQSSADTIRFDSQNFSDGYLNFARCNVSGTYNYYYYGLYDNSINDPHTASFGRLSVYYLFEGVYIADEKKIIIHKVEKKIRDGFDFKGEQILGRWNKSIFEFSEKIGIVPLSTSKSASLSNKTFNDFREHTNIGKDFYIVGTTITPLFVNYIFIDEKNDIIIFK